MLSRFVKILVTAALLPLFSQTVPAQTAASSQTQSQPTPNKAETTLYQKTVAKPSVKAADKFLKKYPESVYAQKVQDGKIVACPAACHFACHGMPMAGT